MNMNFSLKTNLFRVTPMSAFGYKTIHIFIVYGTTNLFDILYASLCMSMSWFSFVQGRQ